MNHSPDMTVLQLRHRPTRSAKTAYTKSEHERAQERSCCSQLLRDHVHGCLGCSLGAEIRFSIHVPGLSLGFKAHPSRFVSDYALASELDPAYQVGPGARSNERPPLPPVEARYTWQTGRTDIQRLRPPPGFPGIPR